MTRFTLQTLPMLLGMAVLAGCEADVSSPLGTARRTSASEIPESDRRGSELGPADRPIEFETTDEYENRCSAVSYDQLADGAGSERTEIRIPRSGAVHQSRSAKGLGRYRYVRWDRGTRRKLLEVLCVMPVSAEGSSQTRHFLDELDHRNIRGQANGHSTALLRQDFNGESVWDGSYVMCYYDPNWDLVECEGQTCSPYQMLRADDLGRLANSSVYYCPNGCSVTDFTWYICPGFGTSGGTDFGPGGGTSDPWGTPIEDPDYCPQTYPGCLRALSDTNRARVDSVMFGIDAWDPHCAAARDGILLLLSRNRLYRGNPSIPDIPGIPDSDTHSAQTFGGGGPNPLTHIDGNVLQGNSLPSLAELLVHEGWHVIGLSHPDSERPPYVTEPFNTAAECVDPSVWHNQ